MVCWEDEGVAEVMGSVLWTLAICRTGCVYCPDGGMGS
jgi:hypothetical protein